MGDGGGMPRFGLGTVPPPHSRGDRNGKARSATRDHSGVDIAGPREATISSAGECFCGRRPPAPPSAPQQATAARCHHGMAAPPHWTALRRNRLGTAQNLKSDHVTACFAMRTIAPGGPCRRCRHRLRQKPGATALAVHEPEPNLRQAKWQVPFGRALNQGGEAAAFIAFCWLVPTPPGGLELK